MQTTFPRLLLDHAAKRPDAPALREKEYGIWQTLNWRDLATLVRALAGGLAAAGLSSAASMWWWSARTGRGCTRRCSLRRSLGAIPVPLYQDAAVTEFVFPINNAEVAFAVVEDQEQVDKLLEVRAAVPAAGAHLVRRPARPAQLRRAGARIASMR